MNCACVLVAQLCLTLCDPLDYSLPGFSAHGVFQAGVVEWVAIPFSKWSSQPRDWTWFSCITDIVFSVWATRVTLKLGFYLKKKFCKCFIVLVIYLPNYISFIYYLPIFLTYHLKSEIWSIISTYITDINAALIEAGVQSQICTLMYFF